MIQFICVLCDTLYRAANHEHGRACICGGRLAEWPLVLPPP